MKREIKFRAWCWDGSMKYDIDIMIGKYGHYLPEDFKKDEDIPIMQYIGMKDKNGKEIYEGDIVNINDDIMAVMTICEWHEEACAFVFNNFRYEKLFKYQIINKSLNMTCEVIGNIFENPKLLEIMEKKNEERNKV
jgi:uncharacterized phage protein (TIGR01671 family)